MTDDQIEAIARAYCRNLGLDPDADVHGWSYFAPEVLRAVAMREAIAEVLGEKGEQG